VSELLGLFSPPFQNPVLIFAAALLIFLVVPLAFERFRVPSIIGLLLAGALVGPNGLGLLARDTTFVLLGQVGLLYIMFVAGLEIDLGGFLKNRNRSLGFGAATFFIPQVLGTLMAVYLLGFDWVVAILLASMFASHTLLSYPIARRLGITRHDAVTTAVGGTLLTDTAALLVLAVIAAATRGVMDVWFWVTLIPSVGLYGVAVLIGLPRLGRWFFRNVRGGGVAEFSFILAAVYVSAFLAGALRLEPIIGAFLAGLALNRLVPATSPLMNRIEFVGNALFIPFFLVSTGMLVDFALLVGDRSAWLTAGAMAVTVTVTKYLAALVAQRLFGYSRDEGMVIFGLSVPQAAATLAAVFVGLEIGLFDGAVLNGAILMILVTCLIGPYVTQVYGRRVATALGRSEFRPGEGPQRILVPLANPRRAPLLMDVALLLREQNSAEAVFPISVVVGDEGDAARVAQAERLLAHAVVAAAEADVAAVPLTRIAQNPATALVRAAAEQLASDIVIGWSGRRSAPQLIFGGLLDQLVEESQQQVLVCKLDHPLNTVQRIHLVVPPFMDYNPGFYTSVRTVKRLASRLGAKVTLLTPQGDVGRFARRFAEVAGDLDLEPKPVPSWRALREALAGVAATDLVLLLSARSGTPAHDAHLDRLPGDLSMLGLSFIVLYPSRLDGAVGQGAPLELLAGDRILLDPAPRGYGEAVQALLSTGLEAGALRARVAEALTDDAVGYATEILPGLLLSHARAAGLEEPQLFVGVFPGGVHHERSPAPAHVVALLLSPPELPPAAHLTRLGEVAQALRQALADGDPKALRTPEEVRRWLGGAGAL
jgi:Kef-type K+ transport system membrane component KefB/nucleotide-binding universal stress UspA family protein